MKSIPLLALGRVTHNKWNSNSAVKSAFISDRESASIFVSLMQSRLFSYHGNCLADYALMILRLLFADVQQLRKMFIVWEGAAALKAPV